MLLRDAGGHFSQHSIQRDIPDATRLAAVPTINFFWFHALHGCDLHSTTLLVNYFSDLPAVGLYMTLIGSLRVDFCYAGLLVLAGIFAFLVCLMAQVSQPWQYSPSPQLVAVAEFSPMVSIENNM